MENNLSRKSGKSTFMGECEDFSIKGYLLFTPIFK